MVSNLILTGSTVLFPLVTFPYLTRTLSADSLGRVFFIDAFTQYFIIFSSIGIPFYGIREIAKLKNDKEGRSKLTLELILIQLTLALIFSAIFIFVSLWLHDLRKNLGLVWISCIMIISTSFLIEWFYQGIENYSYITKRSLVIKVISILAILLLIRQTDDHLIYYGITASLILVNALLNIFNFFRRHYVKSEGKILIGRHIKPLLILFSINVSVSVYTVLDTILLGFFSDPLNVSYYNVPLKLVKIFWVLVSGAGVVLIPRIASLSLEKNENGITEIMTKSFNIVILLTIPFCGICLAFPEQILFIISGNKYLFAVNSLRILSIVPLIIGICNVMGTQYLMPIGKEKHILYATVLGLIISLCLNFILIPNYKFIGTSIACVISELSVCIYIYISAKRRTRIVFDWKLLLQILIGMFSSVFITYAIKLDSAVLNLIVFGITYLATFLILQLFIFKNSFINSIIQIINPYA